MKYGFVGNFGTSSCCFLLLLLLLVSFAFGQQQQKDDGKMPSPDANSGTKGDPTGGRGGETTEKGSGKTGQKSKEDKTDDNEKENEKKKLKLPIFTYPEADYDTKAAAFLEGRKIANAYLHSMIEPYNETKLIEQDKKRNIMFYMFNPNYEEWRRREFRERYAEVVKTLRSRARPTLAKVCPKKCIEYLSANFTPPEIGNGSEDAKKFEEAGMARFSANYLALDLNEMTDAQEENCNQWEAKWQCLFGCFDDLEVLIGMKRQLTGDEHLSVNIECPDSGFIVNLPCMKEKMSNWYDKCSKHLAIYTRARDAAINETAEIIEDLKDGTYKPIYAVALGLSERELAAREVRDKQRTMCSLYHQFLDCAISGIKAECSERAASFFHTSVVANFLERILPERISVERIIGTVPAACEFLVNKNAFGLMPINYEK